MAAAIQTSFLAVVCHRTKPAPATADADFIAVDDHSTERYLCKGQARAHHLPATEWICAHIAQACGLPVPPFAIVEMATQPGVLYFGSQWQGGGLDFTQAMNRVSNPEIFGRVFAADLFVHNVDRHMNNYLYLDLAGDVVARVIDFSRAWFHNGWPLPPLPLPSACNTMACAPWWMTRHSAHYVKPTAMLDSIASLPNEWMLDTLSLMPDAWLGKEERNQLQEWWVGSARRARVESAKLNLP